MKFFSSNASFCHSGFIYFKNYKMPQQDAEIFVSIPKFFQRRLFLKDPRKLISLNISLFWYIFTFYTLWRFSKKNPQNHNFFLLQIMSKKMLNFKISIYFKKSLPNDVFKKN